MALGPGPFVTGLEYATDTQATVVGKPEKAFFLEALRDLNCSPEEAVMIGDVSETTTGILASISPSLLRSLVIIHYKISITKNKSFFFL